jgi:hypothetical protein
MDVGLNADKLELLLLIYSRKMPRRCTFSDFEIIIRYHSNYRFLNSYQKKSKWLDLIASFKIHSVRKEGYPDSINKKAFLLIIDVNEIDLSIDMIKITKDMTRNDRYSNRLHMLLLDDPLINGKFSEKTRLKSEYELDEHEREKKKQFQKVLTKEEKEFGIFAQQEADDKMKLEFEKAARGPYRAVSGEYAWGSTSITGATGVSNAGLPNEAPSAAANCVYNNSVGVQGPMRIGAMAYGDATRIASGAGYYGVMDLSGNVGERPITVGNSTGRGFNRANHGNGALTSSGNVDVTSWPGTGAVGAGFRGGHWNRTASFARLSDRYYAADTYTDRNTNLGGRGVRSAP